MARDVSLLTKSARETQRRAASKSAGRASSGLGAEIAERHMRSVFDAVDRRLDAEVARRVRDSA